MAADEEFRRFFQRAAKCEPYPYQVRLAGEEVRSRTIHVPTGGGKTAAAVLAWLYRLWKGNPDAPRRLVYCLPMRVLVEQTRDKAREWVKNLALDVRVYTLMGGEVEEDWELYPEKPAILVGTQDMLLSRALNRGYGMSRYKWPVHFGLVNNDCLWVCDEVQLQGPGYETALQLDLFRRERWHTVGETATWWMTATLERGTAELTVDRRDAVDACGRRLMSEPVHLEPSDFADLNLSSRLTAKKIIECRDEQPSAQEIVAKHQPGTLTFVILNTVRSARLWHAEISGLGAESVLLHSQFRPGDRPTIPEQGLVVSTQVIEAGVDVSAARLWTECAPTTSLVQRLGRLNRYGEVKPEGIAVIWKSDKSAPYEEADVEKGWQHARSGRGVADWPIERRPQPVIRAPDLWELFDTDPDLHGGFTDISGYIRAADREMHTYVFWRDYEQGAIEAQAPPRREELCPAPFYEVKMLLEKAKSYGWLLQQKDRRVWERVEPKQVRAGMTLLLHTSIGGYDTRTGWTGQRGGDFEVYAGTGDGSHLRSDQNAVGRCWESIGTHTDKVAGALRSLLREFHVDARWKAALTQAALWHDQGKSHKKWQEEVLRIAVPPDGETGPWAKFVSSKQFRPGVRHECASALVARKKWVEEPDNGLSALAVYLVAAHHGKVRMALRSMEHLEERNAFGVRESDGYDLECMEIGSVERDGRLEPSWAEMVLDLLGPCDPATLSMPFREGSSAEVYGLGPFRLAWLEVLLRVADWRGSKR